MMTLARVMMMEAMTMGGRNDDDDDQLRCFMMAASMLAAMLMDVMIMMVGSKVAAIIVNLMSMIGSSYFLQAVEPLRVVLQQSANFAFSIELVGPFPHELSCQLLERRS